MHVKQSINLFMDKTVRMLSEVNLEFDIMLPVPPLKGSLTQRVYSLHRPTNQTLITQRHFMTGCV